MEFITTQKVYCVLDEKWTDDNDISIHTRKQTGQQAGIGVIQTTVIGKYDMTLVPVADGYWVIPSQIDRFLLTWKPDRLTFWQS